MACMLVASAQTDPVNEIFDRYANQEGFTVVNINGDLFQHLSGMDTGNKDAAKLAGSVSEFKILVHEGKSGENFPGFHQLVYDKLDKSLYKDLLTVKEASQDVNFLMKEDNGAISELLMIVSGDEDVLMHVKGHFTMKDLAGIAGSMHIDGMENLKMAAH